MIRVMGAMTRYATLPTISVRYKKQYPLAFSQEKKATLKKPPSKNPPQKAPSKSPFKKPLQKTRNQSVSHTIDSPLRNCIHLPQRNHAPVLLPLLLETRI